MRSTVATYVDFDDHLDTFLDGIGLLPDPAALEGTSLVNYLYELCEVTTAEFLVVDRLNNALRVLCHSCGGQGSQQTLFLTRLYQVMFPKPVVIVFPLLADRGWLTKEQVSEIVPAESKQVYLKCSEIDRAYFKEHSETLAERETEGGAP
jgi:hypothetical protein